MEILLFKTNKIQGKEIVRHVSDKKAIEETLHMNPDS